MIDFPPHIIELLQRQLSQFGRVGATKIYGAPDLATAIPVSSISPVAVIPFKEPGLIIGMYGSEILGTAASYGTTRVRVRIGGQEDLFTDGTVGIFRSMLSLFGGAQNWFPMLRRVIPGVDWVVQYQNLDAAVTKFPEFSLSFIADADIARLSQKQAR
jgi:hypothetical protein